MLLYFSGWLSMAFGNRQWLRVHHKHLRLECSVWLVQTNDPTNFQKPWTTNLAINSLNQQFKNSGSLNIVP